MVSDVRRELGKALPAIRNRGRVLVVGSIAFGWRVARGLPLESG
jgi:hypothetical protein